MTMLQGLATSIGGGGRVVVSRAARTRRNVPLAPEVRGCPHWWGTRGEP